MSASREKKNRQDLSNQGYVDPKTVRAAEEKAKERKNNRLYVLIAVLFVLVAVVVLVWNSGVIQRNATAMEVDGEKFTPAEVSYFYRNAYSNIANSGYASYYGLDTATPLDDQPLNDTAKMLLGVEEDMSWADYFMKQTKDTMVQFTTIAKEADAENFAFTDEMNAEVQDTMDSLASYAKQYGYSAKDYVKLIYGGNMTLDTFEKLVRQQVLVSGYTKAYQEGLNYTDSDLQKYYESDKDCFDVAAYDYIYFSGTAASTTDANGNTVEPTEEENAAKMAQAKEDSQAALERVTAGEDMEKVADSYEGGTFSTITAGTNYGDELSNWVFDSARKAGETAVLETEGGYYVVKFGSVGRQEYRTVNVRHILIDADTDSLDQESETYDADVKAANDAAKAEAEDILQQWKSGAATEQSFAELAKEYSADGNASSGGLYENVYKNQMVTAFNDWCFDPARKTGDTAVVETNYGYHVMYFVDYSIPYWKVQVKDEMTNADMNEWLEGLTADKTAVEGAGMKYVNF